MALKDQLLGLGSSIYNLAGSPFGGAGALQLGSGLNSLLSSGFSGLGNIAGGLSSLGGAAMPGVASMGLALPGLLGGLFGGMTEAQNRMDEVKDVQTARARFQDIAKDPGGWLAQQTASGNSAIPSDTLGTIDKAALSGKLTVPAFQDMLLGPENQTPELREALTGLMYGGSQHGYGPEWTETGWHPTVGPALPWGHTGDAGAAGESGHRVPAIPGWPAGMISPLETDLGGKESPGRGGVTGVMGPWMNRLYAQIHDPNYSYGLSTGGPAGLLADFQRIGPDVYEEGE